MQEVGTKHSRWAVQVGCEAVLVGHGCRYRYVCGRCGLGGGGPAADGGPVGNLARPSALLVQVSTILTL